MHHIQMLGNTIKNIKYFRSIRYHSTDVKIGSPIQSKEELNCYLSTPSWSIEEFMKSSKSSRADSIDETTVKKLLELSGLERDPSEYKQVISVLKSQVLFIDHLHSIPDFEIKNNTSLTPNSKALTLEELQNKIKIQNANVEKGEVSNSWDPLSLAKESLNGQYIVKEGLIKNK